MHIGILKETKTPHDKRTAITPSAAVELLSRFPEFSVTVQRSEIRCFNDKEYRDKGIEVTNDLSSCDLLVGVKEVEKNSLIDKKSYLFFSHTGKKQPYNRELLQEIVKKQITLIDYEYLTGTDNSRLVAFGRWAGIIGAYNGLRAFGLRNKVYDLKPAHQCFDLKEMLGQLKRVTMPPVKILITGNGRVAGGAMETLAPLKFEKVKPREFLLNQYNHPVICQIEPWDYVRRKDGEEFDLKHFYYYPEEYDSDFYQYATVTDIFIPCHYWDPRSPVFLRPGDYLKPDFKISVIADISCDIKQPIASTIRASEIEQPFYGFDPLNGTEGDPFSDNNITVMAVDNLPGELPRDASEEFSTKLIDFVFPAFLNDRDGIIERATIVKNGQLTQNFAYLQNYLLGKE